MLTLVSTNYDVATIDICRTEYQLNTCWTPLVDTSKHKLRIRDSRLSRHRTFFFFFSKRKQFFIDRWKEIRYSS